MFFTKAAPESIWPNKCTASASAHWLQLTTQSESGTERAFMHCGSIALHSLNSHRRDLDALDISGGDQLQGELTQGHSRLIEREEERKAAVLSKEARAAWASSILLLFAPWQI